MVHNIRTLRILTPSERTAAAYRPLTSSMQETRTPQIYYQD
jgi:hypothetical protein